MLEQHKNAICPRCSSAISSQLAGRQFSPGAKDDEAAATVREPEARPKQHLLALGSYDRDVVVDVDERPARAAWAVMGLCSGIHVSTPC